MAKNEISKMAENTVAVSNAQIFEQIGEEIKSVRQQVYRNVNHQLIDLYWHVGRIVSEKVVVDGWGKKTIIELANYLKTLDSTPKGFSAPNISRMRQFFETYAKNEILSPLVRELPWTHNMVIINGTKNDEAREFYLKLAIKNQYTKTELYQIVNDMLFERWAIYNVENKELIENKPALKYVRDNYSLEFLDLPSGYSENDLELAIVDNLEKFLLEFGEYFTFVGRQYKLQVGNHDFFIDLLFYHRKLKCFVAVELKIGEFMHKHISQLDLYLEALDRDVKLPDENPSVGILLVATKDDVLVDYSISRTVSPTMVADYKLQLPDKDALRAKLHELGDLLAEDLPKVDDFAIENVVNPFAKLTPETQKVAKKIVKYVQKHGSIDSDAAHEIVGKSMRSAQRLLIEMSSLDLLKVVGSTRNRLYELGGAVIK
jgi:predicted nuclease of restriction endonuclease-like (RecB) superfamily